MSFAWARLFYLYGPYEDTRRLVPAVTLALLEGRPARTTSGEQVRDFLHVDDVADAICAVAAAHSGPVNIGSGRPTAVRSLVLELARIVGHPELIELGSIRTAAGRSTRGLGRQSPSGRRMRLVAALQPRDGLRDAVAWWRERLAT